ncbi:Endoglucanase-7 [Colletotrichum tropicale]|nr:Endoglucanase-7 [Colletotrichum tropicale]
MLKSLSFLGLLASVVAGHGVVDSFKTDGVEHSGYQLIYYYDKKNGKELPELAAWSAENLDSGFVAPENYTSPDIVCQKNGVPANSTVKVSAGGTVEFHWTRWAHFGPMMTYVARCPSDDCSNVDKTALEFVKIDEAGINFDTQEWAARAMVNNNNTWVTTVPKSLAAGSYVFRHETIAVHGSFRKAAPRTILNASTLRSPAPAQQSPKAFERKSCTLPLIPAYVLFNPYKTPIQNYTIPGPALFRDGEAATNTSAAPSAPSVQPLVTLQLVDLSPTQRHMCPFFLPPHQTPPILSPPTLPQPPPPRVPPRLQWCLARSASLPRSTPAAQSRQPSLCHLQPVCPPDRSS